MPRPEALPHRQENTKALSLKNTEGMENSRFSVLGDDAFAGAPYFLVFGNLFVSVPLYGRSGDPT
jgi:hypothetical protein